MNSQNIVASAIVEIVPDTSKFKQKLGQQLGSATSSAASSINKNIKINPMVDDIKLRQNAMRIQNQYEKLAGDLRNVFAGIGVVGLGMGRSAIGAFLKTDSAAAKVLRSQLGDLKNAWAGVGSKLSEANFAGKTIGQWVEKLSTALNKLSIEKIERFAKIAGGFAIASGFISALKTANNIMDTFERIGILKDKRSLISDRMNSSTALTTASNLAGGAIGGGLAAQILNQNQKKLQNALSDWLKKGQSSPIRIDTSSITQSNLEKKFMKEAGKRMKEIPVDTTPIKAGMGSLMGSVGKALGAIGLIVTAYLAIKEGEIWLGKQKWAGGGGDQTEVEDWLSKSKEDLIRKNLTKSTSALKGSESFIDKMNPVEGTIFPKTEAQFIEFNKNARNQIESLNSSLEDINRLLKLSPNNEVYQKEKSDLEKSLRSIYSGLDNVQRDAQSKWERFTEQEKSFNEGVFKTLMDKRMGVLEKDKQKKEDEKQRKEIVDSFGEQDIANKTGFVSSMKEAHDSYKKALKNLMRGTFNVGKSNDPEQFLQGAMKSYADFKQEKADLFNEGKDTKTRIEKEYAESNKKAQSDYVKAIENLELKIKERTDEANSKIEILTATLKQLNFNVAPAY